MKLFPVISMLALAGVAPVAAAVTTLTFNGTFDTFYYGSSPGNGTPPPTTPVPVEFMVTLEFDSAIGPSFHLADGSILTDSGSGRGHRMAGDIYGYAATSFTSMTFSTAVIPEIGSAFSFAWSTADLAAASQVGLLNHSAFILFDEDIATTVPTALHFSLLQYVMTGVTSLDVGAIQTDYLPLDSPIIADYSLSTVNNKFTFSHVPDVTAFPFTSYSGSNGAWSAVPEPSALLLGAASGLLVLRRRR